MLAIGAIFRDEYDYLLEWFAWHMIAGFKNFIIADNCSTDGTVAFLEVLEDLGIVTLIYQPIIDKDVQVVAYQRIAQMAISQAVESVLYIDADEFLVHDSMSDGEEARCLDNLLDDPKVGMVGINWRTFGSSGHKLQGSEPVLERFTDFCNGIQYSVNGYLKSITKVARSKFIGPHRSDLFPGSLLVDSNGAELSGFINGRSPESVEVPYSGITRRVVESPLRVHHYVIKSKQEFDNKKMKRGSSIMGIDYERSASQFINADFKDEKYYFPSSKLERLKLEMTFIESLLNSSNFSRQLRGSIDSSNRISLDGWLVDDYKNSEELRINVFVNDVWQSRVSCGFFRPDLKQKNISESGFSGFRYTHPKPLLTGDVVQVKVHANRYVFPGRFRVVIE